MSDHDDDLDDDLPVVSLSQSCEKSELEMPSASEVASQRAREEAAERALQDLMENDIAPRLASLSRSASQGSSGEEGEVNSFFSANDTDLLAALSAAVSALQVTEPQPAGRDIRTERLELLTAMRDRLPAEDVQFVDAYIRVLTDRPEAVDAVTEKLLGTISSALINGWGATSVCGACAWLLCVSLTTTRALRVRRALHALLDTHASCEDVEVVRKACGALQDRAEQLLSAHDAVRSGAGRGADRLADQLLARAVAAVLPTDHQEMKSIDTPPAPLSAENVTSIRSSWRQMSPRAQLTLLRCAGRALAAAGGEAGGRGEGGKGEEGTALLDALAQPLPRASAFHEDRQQVLTNVSKLQLLFRSRFSPECEDILDNSQGSINSELTDTPTEDTQLTGETIMTDETMIGETTMSRETTMSGETVKTERTSMSRETTMSGGTVKTERTSTSRETSVSRDTPMSVETQMSVDSQISPHGSTGEFTKTPEETIKTERTIKIETRSKRGTNKKLAPTVKTSNDTPKVKTQITLDRFMKKKTPMTTETKKETEATKIETKKEMDDYAKSPERKRSRRERHERRCKKGQK